MTTQHNQRRIKMNRMTAVVAALAILVAVPTAMAGPRADQQREATRTADRMVRDHARTQAIYHERTGRCQRRSVPIQTNGPRSGAWVCFYLLTGYDKTGERYECPRARVTVKDEQRAPEFSSGRCQ